ISSQRPNKFLEAVNNACGARPQVAPPSASLRRSSGRVLPSDSTAESIISSARSGARISISSANHQVRTGGWTCEINSGKAVKFAIVVVPNLFASSKPSLIDARYSFGESSDFSALIAWIQSVKDFCDGILSRKQV